VVQPAEEWAGLPQKDGALPPPLVSKEEIMKVLKVYVPGSVKDATDFAVTRGWHTMCTQPSLNGKGNWVYRGVEAVPADAVEVSCFTNDFVETVTVTCGYGHEAHRHTVLKATAKFFGRDHQRLAAHEVAPSAPADAYEAEEEPIEI
jgi:hypothetical protein